MKIFLLLLLFITATPGVMAQLPLDGGFEEWNNQNTPKEWSTSNSLPGLTTTTRSQLAHSGNYAATIRTQMYNGSLHGGTLRSYFQPFTTRLRSLNGWYRLNTMQTDFIRVQVMLYYGGPLDIREFELRTITSEWTSFSFPLDVEPDDGSGTGPVSVAVSFEIVAQGSMPQAGGSASLDDVVIETAPASVGNDPGMATASAFMIRHDGDVVRVRTEDRHASTIHISIHDMLGAQAVHHEQVSEEGQEFVIPIDALPAGCYVVRVRYGEAVEHKKIMVP